MFGRQGLKDLLIPGHRPHVAHKFFNLIIADQGGRWSPKRARIESIIVACPFATVIFGSFLFTGRTR